MNQKKNNMIELLFPFDMTWINDGLSIEILKNSKSNVIHVFNSKRMLVENIAWLLNF